MLREVQGRASFELTPTPILHDASIAPDVVPPQVAATGSAQSSSTPVVPTAHGAPPAPAAPPASLPGSQPVSLPGGEAPAVPSRGAPGLTPAARERSGGSTVARSRVRVEAPPVEDDQPDRTRFWFGVGGAAVALAAIAGGGMIIAGGDDDPPSTTVAPTAPDIDLFVLTPPSEVRVLPNDRGGFNVYFTAPRRATSVEIEVTSAIEQGRTVDVKPNRSPHRIDIGGNNVCVVLRAKGDSGRVSDDSAPVCS